MRASDYLQAKRIIPDLGIWIQCFSLYAAVILTKQPERATSLLLYQSSITKLSQKFNWPSWVVYDNSYHHEAADSGQQNWSKIDPSLHTQCFTGMAMSAEGWCSLCHSVEHLKHNCPLNLQSPRPSAQPHTPYRQATPSDLRKGLPSQANGVKSCAFREAYSAGH